MVFKIEKLIEFFKHAPKSVNNDEYYYYFLEMFYNDNIEKYTFTIQELDSLMDRKTLQSFIDWDNSDIPTLLVSEQDIENISKKLNIPILNPVLNQGDITHTINKKIDRRERLIKQADRNIEMFKEIGCFKQAKSWEYLKKTIR
ncbi:MAG: hypothetical protein ACRC0A_00890 [Chitinophagaceae bacterium]